MEQSKPELTAKAYSHFVGTDFELDVSNFKLNTGALDALQNLRVSYMRDKVDISSLAYINNPTKLVQDLARVDVGIEIVDYLIALHIANTTTDDSTENDDANAQY